jgi:hypothetical protein
MGGMNQNYQRRPDYQEGRFGSAEKTSVKVHNPPGGKSNFSLAFDEAPSYKAPTALKQ